MVGGLTSLLVLFVGGGGFVGQDILGFVLSDALEPCGIRVRQVSKVKYLKGL